MNRTARLVATVVVTTALLVGAARFAIGTTNPPCDLHVGPVLGTSVSVDPASGPGNVSRSQAINRAQAEFPNGRVVDSAFGTVSDSTQPGRGSVPAWVVKLDDVPGETLLRRDGTTQTYVPVCTLVVVDGETGETLFSTQVSDPVAP